MEASQHPNVRPVAAVVPPVPPAATPAQHPGHHACEQCGAAMDATQRYCVWCGAHRQHVPDPATQYLIKTTARTRTAQTPPGFASPGHRSPKLGAALAIALIPVVAALGVALGRSSGNDDKLLAALRGQRPQVINVGVGAGGAGAGQNDAGGAQASSGPSPKGGGQVLSRTSYGTAHQITGFKVTASQLNSGRQIVQHIQATQGKNYVVAQRGLPDQISVP